MDNHLQSIYQSDASRFLDAIQAAQPERESDEAFDPRHDMRAHQDTLENIEAQRQQRAANAYNKDIAKIVLHSDAAQFALIKFHSYSELAEDARTQLEKTREGDYLDGRYGGLAFAYRSAAEQFAKMLDIVLADGGEA